MHVGIVVLFALDGCAAFEEPRSDARGDATGMLARREAGHPRDATSPGDGATLLRTAWSYGGAQDAALGRAVAVGDTNGDGYADVAVADSSTTSVYLGGPDGPGYTPAWTGPSATSLAFTDADGDGDDDLLLADAASGLVASYRGSASGPEAGPSFYGVLAASTGAAAAPAHDVNGDGYDDFVVGAPSVGGGQGAVYLLCGSRNGVVGAACGEVLSGTASAGMGSAVAGAGDVDGDGFADLFVGAAAYANGEAAEGAGLFLPGTASGPDDPAETLEGGVARAACSAVATGDFNNDGLVDYALGCPGYADGPAAEGAIFVDYGGASGPDGAVDLQLEGDIANAAWGGALLAADLDGDGIDDLLVSSPDSDGPEGYANQGWLQVFPGSATGLSTTASWSVTGEGGARALASSVAVGDVDGDGFPDLLIGADAWDDGAGRVFLLPGSATGLEEPADQLYTELTSPTPHTDGGFGDALAFGDLDGDGIGDLIVGEGATSAGLVTTFLGVEGGFNTTPTWSTSVTQAAYVAAVGDLDGDGFQDIGSGGPDINGDNGRVTVFFGDGTGAFDGASVGVNGGSDDRCGPITGLGDVNADGLDDLLYACDEEADQDGAVYLVYGSATRKLATGERYGGGTNAYLGRAVAGPVDLDGDGVPDVAFASLLTLYVDFGSASGGLGSVDFSESAFIGGSDAILSAPGDVEGDGYADLLLGDPSTVGIVSLYSGSATTPARTWQESGDYLGYVIGGGDLDGDGTADIVAGTWFDDEWGYNTGILHVWYGGPSGPDVAAVDTLHGKGADVWPFAFAVGDYDSDGLDELVVGARVNLGPDLAGHVEIYAGGPRGTFDEVEGGVETGGGSSSTCTSEVCDGIDNDCDGDVDESGPDARAWYVDGDGDGHGGTASAWACDAPSGYAATGDDCDDADATVNPGASEACDGDDDDCDGAIDEDAVDGVLGYLDADGDGYGEPTTATRACALGAGLVADGGDCDDADPARHPGALDSCDGVDQDCDGVTDNGESGSTWHPDADGDGFGDPASTQLACTAPAGWLADASDCDDTRALVSPSAVETCNGWDDNCDGGIDESGGATWYTDADGDGAGAVPYVACEAGDGVAVDGDCDDTDPSVFPGAPETCNGLDDDCDGDVDEAGGSTFYADTDGDGFGSLDQLTRACTAPVGYTALGGDCDDRAVTIYPGAPELCDSVDDDCDGLVDEDAGSTWYRDLDGDGYGAEELHACSAPDGYATSGGDCDDTRASVHPGADEWCGGGDEDCDGLVDEDGAVDATTRYADVDGDGFGDPTTGAATCEGTGVSDGTDCDDTDATIGGATAWYTDGDGDGYGVDEVLACAAPAGMATAGGDCDDSDDAVSPGATEAWYDGVDQDCDGNDLDQDGDGVAVAGDCDDTDASVTEGCPPTDTGKASDEGACGCASTPGSFSWLPLLGTIFAFRRRVLLLLPAAGCASMSDSGSPFAAREGATPSGATDAELRQLHGDVRIQTSADLVAVGAGDVDGDGYPDLVLGNTTYGSSYFLAGSADGPATSTSSATSGTGGSVGGSIAWLGDVDQDGYDDVAVGDPAYSSARGRVSVFVGSASGVVTTAAFTATGTSTSTYLGAHVAAAGDVNGDGHRDLLVGSKNGTAVVYYGSATGITSAGATTLTGDAEVFVAGLGDLDHDGYDDIAYSSPSYDDGQINEGEVFVRFGSATGVDSTRSWSWDSDTTNAQLGDGLASGDFDGDGNPDLAVGSSKLDDGEIDEGRITVLYGSGTDLSTSGTTTIDGNAADAAFGAVLGVGDFDADGADDLIVGSPAWADELGGVWVYPGNVAGLTTAHWSAIGTTTGSHLGTAVGAGDFDADGYDDLAVAAPDSDGGYGRTTVFLGGPDLLTPDVYREEDQLFETDVAGDGVAVACSPAGDLNGDGYPDVLAVMGSSGSSLVALHGGPSGITEKDGIATVTDASYAALGDVNGDGYGDVAVGKPTSEAGQADEGLVYVYYGTADSISSSGGTTLQVNLANAQCGASVAGVGDVNHDGYADLAFGCPGYTNGETKEGRVYLHLGSAAGIGSGSAWSTEIDQDSAGFGSAVIGGQDFDGDGELDLAVVANLYDNGENSEGGLFVFPGDGTAFADDPVATWESDVTDAKPSTAVALGDINGDGYGDVVVKGSGTYLWYVIYGGASSLTSGETYSTWATTPHPIGDFDGDGLDDLVLAAPSSTHVFTGEGVVDLHLGTPDGVSEEAARSWYGEQRDAGLGTAACGVDLNADGLSDVLLGMPGYDDPEEDEGAILVAFSDGAVVDDGDCDAGEAQDLYLDADGDGFGSGAVIDTGCVATAGQATNNSDCDDGDETVFPDAAESCNGADDDCDGLTDEGTPVDAATFYPDEDEDGFGDPTGVVTACDAPGGYVGNAGDCDDGDATLSPAALERCDGLDNNCDGDTDDTDAVDALRGYADTDGDGYGDPEAPGGGCSMPPGYVEDASDCDDTSAASSPSATETCNSVDDDCDGAVDELGATLGGTWYADADGDGYGNPSETISACAAPLGYTGDAGDCDDTQPGISPAAIERCDGADEDCDGTVDEDATDATVWFVDGDGDGVGAAEAGRACDAPAGSVAEAGDCDDADASIAPWAAERCDGVDDDCDGVIDELGADGELSWYLDADGDSYGAGTPTRACEAPPGMVADDRDCDDTRAGTNPAAAESCNDLDDDCDGAVDDVVSGTTVWYDGDSDGLGSAADPLDAGCGDLVGYVDNAEDCDDTDAALGTPATSWTDADGDGYGDPATETTTCEPVGVADGTDCDDTDATVYPGADDTWYDGLDADCDGNDDDRDRDGFPIDDDCADGDASIHEGCAEPSDTAGKADESGCGCTSTSGGGLAGLIAAVALVCRRRRWSASTAHAHAP